MVCDERSDIEAWTLRRVHKIGGSPARHIPIATVSYYVWPRSSFGKPALMPVREKIRISATLPNTCRPPNIQPITFNPQHPTLNSST
jgi:hypothetical protein